MNGVVREFGVGLPVLMYHKVGNRDPGSNRHLTIGSDKFKWQMRCLARLGYTTITPSQWIAWCRYGKILPKKPVLLTFDDAYRERQQNALPVMRKCGFTGTVFVVTSEIGGTNSWDQVNGVAKQQLMHKQEIIYWAGEGIEFGAHTRTHPDLRSMNLREVMVEMLSSRDELSEIIKRPVIAFAYPYGRYNNSVVECARRLFSIAFTSDPGINDIQTDLLRQRRGNITPSFSFADPLFNILIGYNPLRACRTKLGHWTRDATDWSVRLLGKTGCGVNHASLHRGPSTSGFIDGFFRRSKEGTGPTTK